MITKVSKKVIRQAKEVVAELADSAVMLNNALDDLDQLDQPHPLPVVTFEYPRHGRGGMTTRFVRVIELDGAHLRGLEINDEYDEEPGVPKTFLVEKIRGGGDIRLLHLASDTE